MATYQEEKPGNRQSMRGDEVQLVLPLVSLEKSCHFLSLDVTDRFATRPSSCLTGFGPFWIWRRGVIVRSYSLHSHEHVRCTWCPTPPLIPVRPQLELKCSTLLGDVVITGVYEVAVDKVFRPTVGMAVETVLVEYFVVKIGILQGFRQGGIGNRQPIFRHRRV